MIPVHLLHSARDTYISATIAPSMIQLSDEGAINVNREIQRDVQGLPYRRVSAMYSLTILRGEVLPNSLWGRFGYMIV